MFNLNKFFLTRIGFLNMFTVLCILSIGSVAAMGNEDVLKIEFSNLAKVLLWDQSPKVFSIGALKIFTGKDTIGADERWMDVVVKLDTTNTSLENTEILVKVRDVKMDKVGIELKCKPLTANALVRIDMRKPALEYAYLCVEWRGKNGNLLGIGQLPIFAEPVKVFVSGTRIPITIDLPAGISSVNRYPVRFGVPFARGTVWSIQGLKVVDTSGKEIPSQFEIAGRWAEQGSIKWMWVDTLISGKSGDNIYIETGEKTSAGVFPLSVSVEKVGELITVKTGVSEYTVGRDGGLIKECRYDKRIVIKEGNANGLYVIDQNGRVGKASAKNASMKVESSGPISAVIRIEGDYRTAEGEDLAHHITRLKFTAGRPEVEATHTLILTRATNEVWFRDIGWEFEISSGVDAKALFSIGDDERKNFTDGKVVMTGAWRAASAKENSTSISIPQQSISIPIVKGKTYRIIQKEGISLGLKPVSLPIWNRATNPTTPWAPYLHGKNIFEIRQTGKQDTDKEGIIGDWFAVRDRDGGFMFSCRDAAAQHPKEFEVSGNRMNIKLFSCASGKELDFRMGSLMKNWGMLPIEKVDSYDKVPRKLLEDYLNFISKHSSNAIGWAKTHYILMTPLTPTSDLSSISFLHSEQVFAHVSPFWIRETRVMGPMHPRDKENFPLAETLIENLFWGKVKQGDGGPVGGFIDYNAGPHWIIHSWRSGSYTIRSDSWYLYVRSADRSIRKFAEGANRAFVDNNIAHWSSPTKVPGLLIEDAEGPGELQARNRKSDLPMYWEGSSKGVYEQATVANYDQILLDYYITGSRRAGDIMASFVQAIKKDLTPTTHHWRVILAVRHLAQAYEFSWDPRIKELIYEITDRWIYDPESAVLLTKARPHRSSTYKMETDGDVFVELYDLFGDRLFYKMAMAIAQYNWDKEAITPPKSPSQNRSTGTLGYFLWEETGNNPSVVARFDYGMRRLVAERLLNQETGEINLTCVSQIPRYFKGLPLAMDVMERTKNQKPSSYLAFSVEQSPIKVFITKPGETKFLGHYAAKGPQETSMEILVKKEESASVEHFKGREENGIQKPWVVGNSLILKPHTVLRYIWMGHDLHKVIDNSFGTTKINIPKDAPGGIYEIDITDKGDYSVFTDKHAPLVLYAPDGWTPSNMNPPVRIYFNVPDEGEKGRIFFEKPTALFTPDGRSFKDGEKLFGWVDIPQDKPGLWSFDSLKTGKVKTENLPGFFTMGNPDFYMEYK